MSPNLQKRTQNQLPPVSVDNVEKRVPLLTIRPTLIMTAPTSRILLPTSPNSPSLGTTNGKFQDINKPDVDASPSGRLLAKLGHHTSSPNRVHENTPPTASEESRGSYRSWHRFEGLSGWEKDVIDSPEVQRKAQVAQLCR